jgi:RNA polymerase sigma-B factor
LQIEDTKGTPEDRLELLELKKSVVKALNKLPRREKQVLELRFYKNKKIKDIATELGVSSSRVSKIIQTGLDRIKVSLTSEGIFY